MPGQHSNAQKLLGFWCDPDFLGEIDRARGHTPRSQFMRDALTEKLSSLGIEVPVEKTVAPDRAGKGGPAKKVVYHIRRQPKAKPVSGAATLAKKAAGEK